MWDSVCLISILSQSDEDLKFSPRITVELIVQQIWMEIFCLFGASQEQSPHI